MSLISDPEYLIHNLRLTYLRHVEDPYGTRIIKINPNYSSNAYIVASGLADPEKWPELNATETPDQDGGPNGERGESISINGFAPSPNATPSLSSALMGGGATGLKYTQTIMGNRSGGLGMRVTGDRRTSGSKERRLSSSMSAEQLSRRLRSDSAPTPVNGAGDGDTLEVPSRAEKRRSMSGGIAQLSFTKGTTNGDGSPISNGIQEDSNATPGPIYTPFKPPFARAAEMEARRKARLRKRARAMNNEEPYPASDAESSSSSEDTEPDSDFGPAEDDDDTDVGHVALGTSFDDSVSVLSGSTAPENVMMGLGTSLRRGKRRLSPVSEVTGDLSKVVNAGEKSDVFEESFSHAAQVSSKTANPGGTGGPSKSKEVEELSFERIAPPPRTSTKSSLSSMMASQSSQADNPFSEFYASVGARQDGYTLSVFFPHSNTPLKSMELQVQRESTVEETIGFALWTYWEQKWLPPLDEGVAGDEEKERIQLSAIGYSMRIAEEDGEVDEDFPPLDRAKRISSISSFNSDDYAVVLEKSQSQIMKNMEYEGKLFRRPSRMRGQRVNTTTTLQSATTYDTSSTSMSGDMSMSQSFSLGPSLNHGPSKFLRIRLADQANVVHVSTTIEVTSGTYLAEALEIVCRKRKFNPKEWVLFLKEPRIPLPLDRTVNSLQGKSELLLVKKADNTNYEIKTGRTTDPDAPILQRMSMLPEDRPPDDFAAFKKYKVTRKLPVLGHNERALAIDGDYVHIMPGTSKGGILDNSKTASYHVKSVMQCAQSHDSSASFKLVVRREGTRKRYDFEAESAKQAEEIVHTLKTLQKVYRTDKLGKVGTIKQKRNRKAS